MARPQPAAPAWPAFLDNARLRDLVLFAFPFLLYFATVFNGYNIDDELVAYGNPRVAKGLAGIPEILTTGYIRIDGKYTDYRPLVQISFALEHQVFGFNPAVSHFVNLLLCCLTVVLLYRVLVRLFGRYARPEWLFAATLLFAAHPLHSEVVCNLKNRDELLSFIFFLLTLSRFDRFLANPGWKSWSLTLLCLGLALLSKLSAAPLLGILPAYAWLRARETKQRVPWVAVLLFPVLILGYMYGITSNSDRPVIFIENPIVRVDDIGTRLANVLNICLVYFRLLLFPAHLGFYYGYNTVPLVDVGAPGPLVSLILHLCLAGLAWFRRRTDPFISWVVAGYFLSIGLYISLVVPYTGIISERAMYVASLFFLLLVVMLLRDLGKGRERTVLALLFVLAGAYGVRAFVRVFDWKDPDTLMSRDLVHLSNSAQGHYMYAYHLDRSSALRGDTAYRRSVTGTALYHYLETIRILPDYADSYFRVAEIERYTNNDPARAAGYYRQTYQYDTTRTDALSGYAGCQLALGRFAEAAQYYAAVYTRIPRDTMTLFYFAQALDLSGDEAGAERINRELLDLAPGTQYPYLNLGAVAYKQGRPEASVAYYEQAVRNGCRDVNLLNLLAQHFLSAGDTQKANEYANLNLTDPLP